MMWFVYCDDGSAVGDVGLFVVRYPGYLLNPRALICIIVELTPPRLHRLMMPMGSRAVPAQRLQSL